MKSNSPKLVIEYRGSRIVRNEGQLLIETEDGTDALGVLRWRQYDKTDSVVDEDDKIEVPVFLFSEMVRRIDGGGQ